MQDANTRQLDPLSDLGHAHECFMLRSRNYITCNQCVGFFKYFPLVNGLPSHDQIQHAFVLR